LGWGSGCNDKDLDFMYPIVREENGKDDLPGKQSFNSNNHKPHAGVVSERKDRVKDIRKDKCFWLDRHERDGSSVRMGA